MSLLLRLWLLLSCLLIISHCEVTTAAPTTEVAEADEADGEDAEADQEEAAEEGEEEGEEAEAEEAGSDEDESEVVEPLTSEQMRALHKKIDANGNGKVSLAEVTDFAQTIRRSMAEVELKDVLAVKDNDKDGKLSFTEFLGDPGKVPEREQNEKVIEFKSLDLNSDKYLDHDELASLFHHHTNDKVETTLTNVAMKDKDKNKDGVLSLEEFYAHLQTEDEEEAPVEITEEDKDIFNKLDIDGSKTLTLKELKAWESGSFQTEEAMKKLMEAADKDKDNSVTADEMDAARHDIANDIDYDAQMHLTQWVDHHGGEL